MWNLYLRVGNERPHSLERHFEVSHEQQELLWFAVIKKGHFKLVQTRLFDVGSLPNLISKKSFPTSVSFLLFINVYLGRIHMNLYCTSDTALLMLNFYHHSISLFDLD